MILRIVARDFVAGVETENGVVRDAAPVIRYMLGWPHGKVLNFCYLKGWSVAELDSRHVKAECGLQHQN